MKRGTPRHPKMYALAAALKVRLPEAVGIMEMLWHFAAQQTPRGDLGSLPDAAIAESVAWVKSPATLIDGLVLARWIERSEEYRLVIHDWPDHCEQSVVKLLEYPPGAGRDFLPIYRTSLENRKRKSRESLPSRGAKAKAMAEAESGELKPEELFKLQRACEDSGEVDYVSTQLQVQEKPTAIEIFEECEQVYIQAGAPIPPKQKQLCIQYILGIDPAGRRRRVPNYVKWAISMGKWPDAGKTKALINVLRDGDWDVELVVRTLPNGGGPNGGGNESTAERTRRVANRDARAMNPDVARFD